MNINRLRMLAVALMALTLVVFTGSALAASAENIIKVGKKGDVVFSDTTQIGEVTLKPGHYQFQHSVVGDEHFVKFTELTMFRGEHATRKATETKDVGEIKCTVEPLKSKVTQTAIYTDTAGGVNKITRIEVSGENVAHVF